jgi:hypothetical protein
MNGNREWDEKTAVTRRKDRIEMAWKWAFWAVTLPLVVGLIAGMISIGYLQRGMRALAMRYPSSVTLHQLFHFFLWLDKPVLWLACWYKDGSPFGDQVDLDDLS